MRVLHIAPHPDDEVLGAGATLLALIEAGHEVTNLAASLGRRRERERRRRELEQACEKLALPLEAIEPPLAISVGEGDDLNAARERLAAALAERVAGVELLIGPSPHDAHPAHALVGRAAAEAVAAQSADPPRLWLWGLWSSLPLATTVTTFGEPAMRRLEAGLRAHRSQVERSGYKRLLRAKATVDAVLGPERVFGYGAGPIEPPFAELSCELVREEDRWLLGAPRLLAPERPFPPATDVDAGRWLEAPAPAALLGRIG